MRDPSCFAVICWAVLGGPLSAPRRWMAPPVITTARQDPTTTFRRRRNSLRVYNLPLHTAPKSATNGCGCNGCHTDRRYVAFTSLPIAGPLPLLSLRLSLSAAMDSTRRRVLYQLNSRWIYGKIVRTLALWPTDGLLTCDPNSRCSTPQSSSYKWPPSHSLPASTTATMRSDPVSKCTFQSMRPTLTTCAVLTTMITNAVRTILATKHYPHTCHPTHPRKLV